ncbi:Uncharacterised protein [Mycobacteroides abscessus subsp. abscessus]|nr:Uncharacterised protein [Mycobacteroides abscessus subsp. abscessus]
MASLPAMTSSTPSTWPSAEASTHAVCTASEPWMAGSLMWMALSAPMDSALRMASVARSGPADSTVTSPPCASLISSASSTARSLISSSTASAASRSRVKSPSDSLRSDHVSGTCLMSTTMFGIGLRRPPVLGAGIWRSHELGRTSIE